ncbi:MAG TPA: hypothetical protein VHY91_23870 [Pirellulales bacterium]|jgi:hypothetical protein|nr:hypothetical protein [Pirellulales bacterium]
MNTAPNVKTSPFHWNRGAWWGSQLGGSAWALPLGVVLLFQDIPSALVCLASFAALTAYGLRLWRLRDRLTAYAGLQRLLLAMTVFYAVIIVTLNLRGISEAQTDWPFHSARASVGATPAHVPYWPIALPLAVMLLLFLQQRATKRSQG